MYDLRVTVEEVRGFCDLPMRPGDCFEVRGGRITIPSGGHICMWALAAILPMLPAKQRRSAEENDWIPTTHHMSCPDPNGMVIYRIDRIGDSHDGTDAADAASAETAASRPPKRLLVKERLCSGCTACELACSAHHEDGAFWPAAARIRVAKCEAEGLDRPIVCRQCGQARCVEACPSAALSRHSVTRAILIDATLCTGCGDCAAACPFGAVRLARHSPTPLICDLCGGAPACVGRCATGALKYGRAGEKTAAAPAEPYWAPPELPPEPDDADRPNPGTSSRGGAAR